MTSSGPAPLEGERISCCVRRKERFWRRGLTCLVLLAVFIGWLVWQQNGLSSETLTVTGVPAPFNGYRIAEISDVHGKEFGRDNERLLSYVRALCPDIIAITGDLIHDEAQLAMVPALARGLAAIAPTYYVTGNHEWAAKVVPQVEKTLTQCGVTVLSNTYVMLQRNGGQLALLGAEDSNGRADQKTVAQLADQVRREQGKDTYEILLSHRNNQDSQYARARVDLTLAGHAHGGLIRLPGTDGLIGPKRERFPQHTAGLYDLSYGKLVVSRGLGNQSPAFRLFNRPDVPLVILKGR